MRSLKNYAVIVFLVLGYMFLTNPAFAQEKIGVLYITHGGFEEFSPKNLFDSSAQIFAVRPDHPVHRIALWNPAWWPLILTTGNGPKEMLKYSWEYERLGGIDPFPEIVDIQTAQIAQILQDRAWPGTKFVVDFTGWLGPDQIEHFSYPRFLYTAPDYAIGGADLTYCGESEQGNGLSLDFSNGGAVFSVGQTLTGNTSGATAVIEEMSVDSGTWSPFGGDAAGTMTLSGVSGTFSDTEYVQGSVDGWAMAAGTTHWDGCDPDRYNVDGPAERFIAAGVDRIIAIDMTTSGVRFFKTFDVLRLFKQGLAENGGAGIPVHWINDPNDLMQASLPTGPIGFAGIWTPDKGTPDADVSISLAENPNPIAEDTTLATLLTEGAEAGFNISVPNENTAVLILNHATGDYAQYFDPKINDTLIINQNIETLLLDRNPGLNTDNIVGAFMGIKEDGTAEGYVGTERTRNMRGENLGHAWLYETGFDGTTYNAHGDLPGGKWGYLYWDALEYLKNQEGVQHIVIVFPQIVADSVLNLVEQHNQIAKEIGFKNWRDWGTPDYTTYPVVGHPFADYWGIWVDKKCGPDSYSATEYDCCFEMGGCSDGRPYPPPRQATGARGDLDPSLAYDVSEYGHLGYNPAGDPLNPDSPVQNQFTGTWAFYRPPNLDIRLADMLADHVLAAADPPDIYGTISGDIVEGVTITLYTQTCGALNPVDVTITDINGNYEFDGIESGGYLVQASYDTLYLDYSFEPIRLWIDIPQAVIQPYDFTSTGTLKQG